MKAFLIINASEDTSQRSRQRFIAFAVLVFLGLIALRIYPSLQNGAQVSIRSRKVDVNAFRKNLLTSRLKKSDETSHESRRDHSGNLNANNSRERNQSVIERTLFDGKTITLRARLLSPVSSKDGNPSVEAEILGVEPSPEAASVYLGAIQNGKVHGTATPQFSSKRIFLNFQDLESSEGRSYAITGYGIDTESHVTGIKAQYSSGLGKRLLGVGVDRAITVVDQIAVSQVIGTMTSQDPISRQIQQGMLDANQQASGSIASEATKDLRSTEAELSLEAGVEILIRVRSTGRTHD